MNRTHTGFTPNKETETHDIVQHSYYATTNNVSHHPSPERETTYGVLIISPQTDCTEARVAATRKVRYFMTMALIIASNGGLGI